MWNTFSSSCWKLWKPPPGINFTGNAKHLSPKVAWLFKEQRQGSPILTVLHNFMTNIIMVSLNNNIWQCLKSPLLGGQSNAAKQTIFVYSHCQDALILSWTSNREPCLVILALPALLATPPFPTSPSPSWPHLPSLASWNISTYFHPVP